MEYTWRFYWENPWHRWGMFHHVGSPDGHWSTWLSNQKPPATCRLRWIIRRPPFIWNKPKKPWFHRGFFNTYGWDQSEWNWDLFLKGWWDAQLLPGLFKNRVVPVVKLMFSGHFMDVSIFRRSNLLHDLTFCIKMQNIYPTMGLFWQYGKALYLSKHACVAILMGKNINHRISLWYPILGEDPYGWETWHLPLPGKSLWLKPSFLPKLGPGVPVVCPTNSGTTIKK